MSLLDAFLPPVLTAAERQRIEAAIGEAERGHRGEIRVHVERHCPRPDPLVRARELFSSLGMEETAEGTAALLYVATEDHKAAVWAGSGLYEARDPQFWEDAIDEVVGGFLTGAPARGIVIAVRRIGKLLATLAPGEDVAGNELTDEVSG